MIQKQCTWQYHLLCTSIQPRTAHDSNNTGNQQSRRLFVPTSMLTSHIFPHFPSTHLHPSLRTPTPTLHNLKSPKTVCSQCAAHLQRTYRHVCVMPECLRWQADDVRACDRSPKRRHGACKSRHTTTWITVKSCMSQLQVTPCMARTQLADRLSISLA